MRWLGVAFAAPLPPHKVSSLMLRYFVGAPEARSSVAHCAQRNGSFVRQWCFGGHRARSPFRRAARATPSPRTGHLAITFFVVVSVLLFSTALGVWAGAEAVQARFDRDYATVWRASLAVLEEWPLLEADEAAGVIRSGWREERQPKRWDRWLTQRDRRHRVVLQLAPSPEGTTVSVELQTESRPMGRYSAPWHEDAPSDEYVHALLAAIERALDGSSRTASP